jgi:hypothetical protein
MLFFEVALSSFLFVLTFIFAAGLRNRGNAVNSLYFIPLPVAVTVLAIEGFRWQMATAYFVTIVFALMGLFFLTQPVAKQQKPRSLAGNMLKWTSVAGLLLATVFAIALPLLFPAWTVPAPGGPNKVGVCAMAAVDSSRHETFSANRADRRELLLYIWYPAKISAGQKPRMYCEGFPGVIQQFCRMFSMPSFLFDDALRVRTHSFVNATLLSSQAPLPVLIFSHGIGLGTVGQNSVQMEELASRGYVVVSIGHTYQSCLVPFPNGRIVPADMGQWNEFLKQMPAALKPLGMMKSAVSTAQKDSLAADYVRLTPLLDAAHRLWTVDTRFVIDELERINSGKIASMFTGRLDLSRIGIFGHSMGGMTAHKTIIEEPRIKAGISYDAPPIIEILSENIKRPFMFMVADVNAGMNDPAFERAEDDAYLVTLKNATHFDFNDLTLWFAHAPLFKMVGIKGWIDGNQCEKIINGYTVAFFNKYLCGADPELLKKTSAFTEAEFKSHGAAIQQPSAYLTPQEPF